CSRLSDNFGIEGGTPSETKGLGLFSAITSWKADGGKRSIVDGIHITTGGKAKGYEVHTGETETKEAPLFRISLFDSQIDEGSVNINEKLFGTYMHGLFDEPAFRKYILELTGRYVPTESSDTGYDEIIDGTLDKLADVFESSVDMLTFERIFMGAEK
ncbi:MAG: cobalamin biosynthesis protein CobQ, partial [Methanomassiliicoccaceae archaeon]|nr:cobalamin biosynthesis protein CobQ [Methanomassiliicoccaceae archaeon]